MKGIDRCAALMSTERLHLAFCMFVVLSMTPEELEETHQKIKSEGWKR